MDERQALIDGAHGAKIRNETHYPLTMDEEIVQALERARHARSEGCRVRIHYGNPETGEDGLEEFEAEGYVSRTMGPSKAPLLVRDSRCYGGGIISGNIVRIRWLGRKWGYRGRDPYRHPSYHVPPMEIREESGEWPWRVYVKGVDHAGFKTREKAERWVRKMTGHPGIVPLEPKGG